MRNLSDLKEISQVAAAFATAAAIGLYTIGSFIALGSSFRRNANEYRNLAQQYGELATAYTGIKNVLESGEDPRFVVGDSLEVLSGKRRDLDNLSTRANERSKFKNHLKDAAKSWFYVLSS